MSIADDKKWALVSGKLVDMFRGGPQMDEGVLPEGLLSGDSFVLEDYARKWVKIHKLDLGLVLPSVLATLSGAVQGGIASEIIIPGGRSVPAPLVIQFMGIAPPGGFKSVLSRELGDILRDAMMLGVDWRQNWIIDQVQNHKPEGVSTEAWDKLNSEAVCKSTWTDSGTQEGVRNMMVENGGHRMFITAEPDVLREIGAYGKDGGSIGLMLRSWDQEDLSVDRVGQPGLLMPEPSLPFVFLLQPGTFSQYTNPDAQGNDTFVSRGFFSRSWLWQVPPEVRTGPETYVHMPAVDGSMGSGLAGARQVFQEHMNAITLRTSEYRASKARWLTYEVSPFDVSMPRPPRVKRERMRISEEAGEVYIRVQQLRNELLWAAHGHEMEEVTEPLASRSTSHIMRLAGLAELGRNPKATEISGPVLQDVALRWFPWLVGGWMDVLKERAGVMAGDMLTRELQSNRGLSDISVEGMVVKTLYRLHESSSVAGFTRADLINRARSALPRGMRTAAGRSALSDALDRMAIDGKLVQEVAGLKGKYRLTEYGKAQAGRDLK